jgi:hypothetical protein
VKADCPEVEEKENLKDGLGWLTEKDFPGVAKGNPGSMNI